MKTEPQHQRDQNNKHTRRNLRLVFKRTSASTVIIRQPSTPSRNSTSTTMPIRNSLKVGTLLLWLVGAWLTVAMCVVIGDYGNTHNMCSSPVISQHHPRCWFSCPVSLTLPTGIWFSTLSVMTDCMIDGDCGCPLVVSRSIMFKITRHLDTHGSKNYERVLGYLWEQQGVFVMCRTGQCHVSLIGCEFVEWYDI